MSRLDTTIPVDVQTLLLSACEEGFSPEQLKQLEESISDERTARLLLDCMQLDIDLRMIVRGQCALEKSFELIGIASTSLASSPVSELCPDAEQVAVPTFIFPTTLHSTFTYLSAGWPVAYLIATAIFGIGALVGSFIYVSHPEQVAKQSVSLPSPLSPLPSVSSVVGQITGMVDCQWKERTGDRGQGTGNGIQDSPLSPLIRLGDKFALASGLMEITYRTGAKVILQGPATYVVDAKNGGSINIGRLTGIMEAPDAKGFTLRTPTAVVADLGTEFGVEVDRDGSTTSHVFRGAVSIRAPDDNNDTAAGSTVLRENESARTERASGDGQHINVHRIAVNPDVFVRRIEKPMLPVDVLAWFRMGEDEPNARAGAPAGKDIHSHNQYVRLERHGSPTYSADTEAPGSVLSMTFHGGSDGERFRTSRFPFVANDYFILEAWVKMHKVGSEPQVVAASGQGAQNGYCLAVVDGRWCGALEATAWIDSGVACEIGKWTHLALVCERGKSQLWINGMPAGEVIDKLPIMPDGRFTIGGRPENPQCVFNGEIDEVRLSTFIAPFRPEMLLLRKTEPAQ